MTSFFDDPELLAPRRCARMDRPDGGFELRSPVPMAEPERRIGDWLERWARDKPDALAFAEPAVGTDGNGGSRGVDAWRRFTWRELRRRVGCVAQALLDLGLPADKPIVVLSDNALDHLTLMLAGMHVGRAVCTVSSAYSRLAAGDPSRLHGILRALDPALLYASAAAVYAPPLRGAGLAVPVVFSRGAAEVPGALAFDALLAAEESPAVRRAFDAVTPDTHAKYLLTSGSTGTPKVVINTHRMLCANQQQIAQALPFLRRQPPVMLDWLPWSHTFGANHNLNQVLAHGGTMFVDDGRPMPGLVDKTIAHLRELEPNVYYNVPRGFDMLLPALEADEALASRFLSRLTMLFYAGAAMSAATWQRLEALASRVRDEASAGPLWMTTAWGSTETSPAVTYSHWRLDRPSIIGLPLPGTALKFVPNGGKLEMRVKGPNVFPGYRNDAAATREAFDDEGYYCIGDAGLLADPSDVHRGVVFDGRVAEDFKLSSGTWVSTGTLRLKVVTACAPLVADAVITGHDRDEVGALLFLSEAGRKLEPAVLREALQSALAALHVSAGGSSQAPARALVLPGMPDAAVGEITDKGYINQRLVLTRRAAQVDAVYADGEGVIRV